ncbi:rRNA maturation RNase YbeY [Sinobaca sp. H24]|uniref:rRNA maturation RNase YbeY n=1 Tax=Sinobaca sp. H24 TaxID=2923376 RepID=UPI00207A3519|nr:rRNA maturation RNase YbeY [Sinobaca sp. H24]
MAVLIDINDETTEVSEQSLQLLEEVLQLAAGMEAIKGEAELSVTIVTNDAIQEINKEYRGIDKPTDVISFALDDEEPFIEGDDVPHLLGDIVISAAYHRTGRRVRSFFREGICFWSARLLHLLGYLHDSESEEKEMFARQEEILQEYGLKRQ